MIAWHLRRYWLDVPSRFSRYCGAFFSVAAALVTPVGEAETASLDYRAPLDCPGEADFVRAVACSGFSVATDECATCSFQAGERLQPPNRVGQA